jgi:hypothetical protein
MACRNPLPPSSEPPSTSRTSEPSGSPHEGRPSDDIGLKRAVALDHFQNVRAVVHGGSPVIADQRAITKFLYTSRLARERVERDNHD